MKIGNTDIDIRPIKVGDLGAFKTAYENYAGAFGAGDPDEIARASRALFDIFVSNSSVPDPDAVFKELDTDTLWAIIISVPGEPIKSMIEAGAENLKNLPALMKAAK
jgi:hypothetical protein